MEIKLVIVYDTDTKRVAVSGGSAIEDVVGCYGMLERAKDAIRNQAQASAQQAAGPDAKPAVPT